MSGFRNEDDYAAACLTSDERRELQRKLRELTQEDLELKADKENVKEKILELQSGGIAWNNDDLMQQLKFLKNSLDEIREKGFNNSDLMQINELMPEIKKLTLLCGLEEVF